MPAERIAFVLQDMFAVSFGDIDTIVGRSPIAARQLASRARRRVQGVSTVPEADRAQKREIVEAFLVALRRGDIEGLFAVLDPEVVVRVDEAGARQGAPREIRGARNWAQSAVAFSQAAQSMQPAVVDGPLGLVWAPGGRPSRVLRFVFGSGKIGGIDIIADPTHLSNLDLTILHDTCRNTES